jgi:hypothetical protein
MMSGLAAAVRDKLGISFEAFSEQISEEESFQNLLGKKLPEEEKAPFVIDVRPKNHEDYRFVGVNNKMKGNNYSVRRIRRFL